MKETKNFIWKNINIKQQQKNSTEKKEMKLKNQITTRSQNVTLFVCVSNGEWCARRPNVGDLYRCLNVNVYVCYNGASF